MASATFTGPNGEDPSVSIHRTATALRTITTGDLLYAGQVFRSKIRQRTLTGTDVNGSPFAPYSQKGPYYFYPNRDSAGGNRQARATAAKNRHRAIGGAGTRTPMGIRFDSYAAAKAAHGRGNVDLYGLEQHTHMLDTILVKAGGAELDTTADDFLGFQSDLNVFEQNQPGTDLTVGFYGPEAERAKGNNEGNSRLPARNFFALNQQDLDLAEVAIGNRIEQRANQS